MCWGTGGAFVVVVVGLFAKGSSGVGVVTCAWETMLKFLLGYAVM